MTVTLGTTPYSNWQILTPLLENLGCATGEQSNPEHWYLAEAAYPEGYLLLAYTRPEQALASAMEQGITPGQALQQWTEHAEALVKLFKANRRQAVLIDLATARQHPERAATALASHWQLEIDPAPSAPSAPTEPANSFYQLVANAAVQQEKQLHPMLAQLEACTLPVVDTEAIAETSQDVDALYTQLKITWQELETAKQRDRSHQQQLHQTEQRFTELQQESSELKQTNTDYEKQLASAREESQLLLEQLHLVQEELESHAIAAKNKEQSLANLKTQLEQANKQARDAEKQYTQAEQARAKAEQEKGKTEQALAKAEQTEKASKAEQKNLQTALTKEQTGHTKTSVEKATLENHLKAVKTANQDQAGQLENLAEENQLLLEQLHLVQEELENKFLQAAEQEKSLADLKTQLEQSDKQARDAEKQYTQAEQARAKAEQEKGKTEQALAKAEQTEKAAQAEIKNLQIALKKEQTGHTKTSAEKATLENQLKALKTVNKDQTGQLENLAEENQLLLEQLHLVQEELENKFLQAGEQEKFLANLKVQIEQKDSQYITSQKEAGLLQRRLQKLRDTMESLERTNRSLNGNLSELKNQLAASKKHQADWEHKYLQAERNGTLALAAANRRIAELSTELNKVTNSRTWKLANTTAGYIKKTKKAAADKIQQQKSEIESSGLFDETWYLEYHQDVAEAGLNPIEHYLKIGAYEGRNPSESFDTTWYLIYYRDVTESGLNPLVHYLRYGQNEERASRPGALASLPAPALGNQ
ncbi:hypothetical protein [Marinobacter sp. LV10MA510-1]|uniref:hypothetical protein n=1 Tax=Marinobacter sp. LV10MA510-1 TaxID=1415567 RepID=UPI000BF970E5|nr:hypothetical protein [Marinobacter sp. LV10MA510-1]PFG08986.1 hypothetical protein ATI45_1330 [Marinobacter sp. LV10MA510-1]